MPEEILPQPFSINASRKAVKSGVSVPQRFSKSFLPCSSNIHANTLSL